MSESNGNGRIHLLDRQSPKPSKAQQEKELTEAIVGMARTETIKICEFYLAQLPELVATMLDKAFAAHGLELKPPPKDAIDDEGPTLAERGLANPVHADLHPPHRQDQGIITGVTEQ